MDALTDADREEAARMARIAAAAEARALARAACAGAVNSNAPLRLTPTAPGAAVAYVSRAERERREAEHAKAAPHPPAHVAAPAPSAAPAASTVRARSRSRERAQPAAPDRRDFRQDDRPLPSFTTAARAPASAPAPAPAIPGWLKKVRNRQKADWDLTDDTTAVSDLAPIARPEPPRVSTAATDALDIFEARRKAREAMDTDSARAARDAATAHWSEKSLDAMTDRDWRIMREDFDIHVRGGRPVNPLRFWNEAGIAPALLRAIDALGYEKPSPIQRQGIPMGLAGRDLIGIAETGSGKTAAFLIPLLTHVLASPGRARTADLGPLALVLAPTRELAQQIDAECVKLAVYAGTTCVCVVGGTDIGEQTTRLRNGCDVLIGTPGRLIDCLDNSYVVLHQCRYLVLDEADRMIDLGFEPSVTKIIERMGAAFTGDGAGAVSRTTHMFTATMPPAVERLAKLFMLSPATVRIGDEDSGKNRRITQELIFAGNESKKKARLLDLLRTLPRPAIIFVNAKKQCDIVARDIKGAGNEGVVVLHSDKTQEEREAALADFKAGAADILLATDVAGRGLDIPDVAAVVNYDMPSDIDKYSHRIGRTGRAGKSGLAISFINDAEDPAVLVALKAYLEATGQVVPHPISEKAKMAEREKGRW